MSLEFFPRDNRPTLVSDDFIMYKFEQDGDRVKLYYVIEGALDDWTPLFSFGPEDYIIMHNVKFKHEGIETFALIMTDPKDVESKVSDSIRLRTKEDIDKLNEAT